MNERHTKENPGSYTWKRFTVTALLVAALLAFSLAILLRILLVTPLAADFIGRTLTEYTNHKVSVTALAAAGKTLYLSGVTIENPSGFTKRGLLSIRTISLTPDLAGLARGKRSLARLEIDGLSINAEKNSAGAWNFSSLVQRFAKKKEQPTAEIFIKYLSLNDTSLHFAGHRIEKLGLKLHDFSTKGTTRSKLDLSGKDAAGNPFRLTAQGQLGANPALQLSVDAAAVSLAPLQQIQRSTSSLRLENARAKLHFSAKLRNGLLVIRSTTAIKQLTVPLAGQLLPIEGQLDLEARYDSARDRADLTQATLSLNSLATITASGSMQGVRKDGFFSLQVSPLRINLDTLAAQLPEKTRRGVSLSGEISSGGLSLKGNRLRGITAANGNLFLRKITVSRKKQPFLREGAADCLLIKTAEGWQITGKVFTDGRHDSPLIESFAAPFNVRFSSRFKPVAADLPAMEAVLKGTPVRGSFRYRASAPVPFAFSCSATGVPLSAMNRLFYGKTSSFQASSGKFSVVARLSGHSTGNFAGTATLDIISATATSSTRKISLAKATIRTNLRRTNAGLSVAGSLETADGTFDSKPFSATTEFALDNEELTLRNALFSIGTISIHSKTLSAKLPKKGSAAKAPFSATLAGTEVRSKDLVVSGISGTINAHYGTANLVPSLDGIADISHASLTYRNIPLASCTSHVTFNGNTASLEIRGNSLEGPLTAQVRTGLFSTSRETSFSVRLMQQHLKHLAGLFPKNTALNISAGTADALLKGSYTQQNGVQATLAASGQAITLKGSAGKTLVSGISTVINSKVNGQTLTLQEGTVSHPQGTTLRIRGTMQRFAAANRKGEFSFAMPSTAINSLLDAIANALPRNLQEAVCEGTFALEGTVAVNGKKSSINGDLSLASATLEIPSQKITVAGIEGRLPFSLEFPGSGAKLQQPLASFSRENYQELLKNLSRTAGTGSRIMLERIRFGALETGVVSFFISSAGGIIRIFPIEASLFDGKVLGNGYLILNNTMEYGANMLLHDVSLKQLCDSFPAIKGYITGRVDGIVSLKNSKGGLKALTGFVNLWTRTGKGEDMLVSKDFLQKLAGKKLRGFFFQNDRPYDSGEISAYLRDNFLTFEKLDISHTNFLGMKDLSVSVVPIQNRISLDHLLESIREAAARGKKGDQDAPPVQTDLKWLE